MRPSDHLLRTLAAVAPGVRIVDMACGEGRHLGPLAALGFDVWAATDDDPAPARAVLSAALGPDAERRVIAAASDTLGFPDSWAAWAVLAGIDGDRLGDALAEARRLLEPGGWVWVESDAPGLVETAEAAGLAVAEAPREEEGTRHAIFRAPGGRG